MKGIVYIAFLLLISGCSKEKNGENPVPTDMYFPPNSGSVWSVTSPESLGWNANGIQELKSYLREKNTKSFMILVNGRIVMEEYFDGHSAAATWEWNSAGKTLVTTTTGLAAQEGLLTLNDRVSDHLGTGWTSMSLQKENLITVRNLLTMTAGNDDTKQLMIRSNITYVADAGTRWAYSNIFQKLTDVVAEASNQSFEAYFNEKLKSKIGMEGFWNFGTIFTIYHSNTRSMARFGLLALNNGRWGNQQVVQESFFTQSVSTSQNINPSYGYMWWLNGKNKYMLPSDQTVFDGTLIPNAPADMYAAMGAKDQRIYVIPSKKMVVVRMGEASNPLQSNFAVSGFDNELWGKINAAIN